jgi:predicted dehydrogenase
MDDPVSRRRFLREAPALGAALPPPAARRGADEPLRIGCLNVDSYSHLKGLWAPLMNPRAAEKEFPLTGMRITHCWDIEPDKAEAFAKSYRCTAVRNFDDMAGKVDAVISGGYYNHPWNHLLHAPYLEAGLPNLINRPFANSRAKAKRMLELARRHNAPILVPSAHEHNEAIARARNWAAGKKILCYTATNSHDDYPTHGVHGVYLVCRVVAEAGNRVVSVAYQAASWHSPPGVMTFEHIDAAGRAFLGTLHQVAGSWGTIQIHTQEQYGGESFLIRPGSGFPYNKTEVWAPTLWAFEQMARTGEMPQTLEQIGHKTAVFLAGWRSILLNQGGPVRVEDVPEEWEAPVDLPNRPAEKTADLFRKKFGR